MGDRGESGVGEEGAGSSSDTYREITRKRRDERREAARLFSRDAQERLTHLEHAVREEDPRTSLTKRLGRGLFSQRAR